MLWIGVAALVLLSPLGLLLPELLNSEGAWGEWGADGIKEIVGYVPDGIERLSELWKSPIPDYGQENSSGGHRGRAAYVLSAIMGVLIVAAGAYALGRVLAKKEGEKKR